jgi:hypothetical protein
VVGGGVGPSRARPELTGEGLTGLVAVDQQGVGAAAFLVGRSVVTFNFGKRRLAG